MIYNKKHEFYSHKILYSQCNFITETTALQCNYHFNSQHYLFTKQLVDIIITYYE